MPGPVIPNAEFDRQRDALVGARHLQPDAGAKRRRQDDFALGGVDADGFRRVLDEVQHHLDELVPIAEDGAIRTRQVERQGHYQLRTLEGRARFMGVTNPREAAPGTIRGDLALETGENLVHGSDGPESAPREISLFFPTSRVVARTITGASPRGDPPASLCADRAHPGDPSPCLSPGFPL